MLRFICFNVILVMAASHWSDLQKDHKPRTLSSTKAATLAKMFSLNSFLKDLKPFLKVRVPGTEAHVQVQKHIISNMKALGWHVEQDEFEDDTPLGKKPFNNIIATLNPDAPRKLVIACHYESKYYEKFTFIAATDSAVPCAMMIDIARTMNLTLWNWNSKQKSDVTLELVFLDGEEAFGDWAPKDSLYGSRHLAEKLHLEPHPQALGRELTRLQAFDVFVLFDLMGHKNPFFYDFFDDTSKLFERLIAIERKLSPFLHKHQKYFSETPMRSGKIDDDHRPFMDLGVPALHLISYPFPRFWHTKGDTEKELDYKCIENLLAIFRVFVAEYLRISSIFSSRDEL